MPSLARSPFLRQIYLESNDLADDQVPAICRFIDTHPYLIRLKLGHNRLSAGAQRAIVAHAEQRNPALFFGSWDLASEFGTPTSTYGATAQGARTADATLHLILHFRRSGLTVTIMYIHASGVHDYSGRVKPRHSSSFLSGTSA